MKVQDLMTQNATCCQTTDTIQSAAKIMQSMNCGSVPVCENKRVVGIISDRDIVLRAIASGKGVNAPVKDCMSAQVVTCNSSTDAHEAADLMAQHQVRRLPVVDSSGNLVGICAIGDLATVDIHINEAGDALSRISQPSAGQNAIH